MEQDNYFPEHNIPVATASERITQWQNAQTVIQERIGIDFPVVFPVASIHAFTMRFTEIFNLCARIYNANCPNMPPITYFVPGDNVPLQYDAIRFYLGIRPSDAFPGTEACLMCNPVEGFESQGNILGGNDVASLPLLQGNNINEVSAVYDFSFPCPMTCATNDIF